MPETLPLRRLVLYKHGVGYFTRQGTVDGQELELPFRVTEVDDVLKSLTAFTLDGGQVVGVHYQTPENRDERFAEIPLSIGKKHSLFDLLRSVRGTEVTLRLEGSRSARGRVIGLEEHPQGRRRGAMVVLASDSSVEQIASDRITHVQIEDERVAQDLTRFLDTSQAEEVRRTVHVALSEPGRQLQVSYTAPSPVWRVSYRLVAETSSAGEPSCLLQGWAIFDNRLDEDLEDVEVTLVAGQPVSFRYDLTSSLIPERRLVQDEARVAPGPVEFEGVYPRRIPARSDRLRDFLSEGSGQETEMRTFRSLASPAAMTADDLAGSTVQAAEGRELAELFEYRIGGVSVRRGESAMVPVAQRTSPYRRELLYNGDKLPRHPVASLRLHNETSLTLERGPVTIVEDGQYRGEAILPFTKDGAEIVLAYAVELGVSVLEEVEQWTSAASLELRSSYLLIQEHFNRRTRYTLTNTTAQEQIVMVERARWAELAGTRQPDEETAEHRRWHVPCPPRSMTELVVTERQLTHRHESVLDQHLATLSDYLENRTLDAATRAALEAILRLRQEMEDADARLQELRGERQELADRQDRLRQNLTIAATNEEEHEIRRRSAEEFRRTQDREEEIDLAVDRIRAERQRAEEELQRVIAQLSA